MNIKLYKSTDRGAADFGWFKARYSFSFGQWHHPALMGFGALRVFNDSIIQPGRGFPEHPHDNMEVITVQLQGKLNHTDVSGTRVIQAGDVQVITAGSGVTHSDLNIGTEEARQFQIWIYPDQMDVKPQSNIAHYQEADRINQWQVIASPYGDEDSKLNLRQSAWLSRGLFDRDEVVNYKAHINGNGYFVFVINGAININGQQAEMRDAIGVSGANAITINCIEKSDLLLIEVPMIN